MSSSAPILKNHDTNVFGCIVPGTCQTVAIQASNAKSAALSANTSVVRLVGTAACFVKFAADPTATSADIYVPANTEVFFGVSGGQKIGVLRAVGDGSLYITEGA